MDRAFLLMLVSLSSVSAADTSRPVENKRVKALFESMRQGTYEGTKFPRLERATPSPRSAASTTWRSMRACSAFRSASAPSTRRCTAAPNGSGWCCATGCGPTSWS
jgi:hypothetical protein